MRKKGLQPWYQGDIKYACHPDDYTLSYHKMKLVATCLTISSRICVWWMFVMVKETRLDR